MATLSFRQSIKKTSQTDEGRQSGPLGTRRSPFPTAWFALSMWIPPEVSDPVLQHHPTRKSVGYFGAVRLRDGKFVFRRETDKFNAQTFLEFLRLLRQRTRRAPRPAVIITDNAKYHHARLHKEWRAKHAKSLSLDFLPPYSPELNPIERVWKLTRRLSLHNRYFEKLELVIQVVEDQFLQWSSPNETLRRLCAIT